MGVPIVLWDGFEVVPPPEINDVIISGSEKTVSNCGESTITTEEDGTVFSRESSPGGVAEEEWSGAKPFSFYFVKHRVYDDPEIKAKIDEADQEIYRCNKHRINVSKAQKSERAEISSLSAQIKSLVPKSQEYRLIFEEKKREFDTLLEAIRNLPCSNGDQRCFSKEELDHLIYKAHYQIEHGIGLEDGDSVVKDIEKPDGIILSEDSLAQKEASINRVRSIAVELHAVKKELDAITWNINHVTEKLGKSQNNLRVLDMEMAHILEERDKYYERIKKLRIQRDKGNAAFFEGLTVTRKAKELAACGNVRDLEVFASSEVDRFMNQWNDDKAFRDDYVKRISLSLCERQLDRDGRIKDPEVQAVWEKQVPKTMMASEKVHKTNRENSSSNSSESSQDGNVITDEQKKDTRKESMDINRSSAEESDVIDMEFPVSEKPEKEEEEVDEETLKEMKREEQIEKARLAMERKRKLQEKAAAKATIRAQKEAEKKLKECAKKAKKKAAANSTSLSESDQSREITTELEKDRTITVSGKEKQHLRDRSLVPKQKSFRHKHRRGGTEALPKAILNRRRAHKYWVWGLSSAALACVLILVFLLIQLTGKGKGLALPDRI